MFFDSVISRPIFEPSDSNLAIQTKRSNQATATSPRIIPMIHPMRAGVGPVF
ncbi:hypothetical protein RSSM_04946 [Rhodopirellula sallentina SM41]|uniref:Uncharacterized protein n=1 Tax=Rhodopirellula sallentina SM41 TaxID=1263870 RepID=M5U6U9_9BACT|nr:hypothetical protein RSSM_04946 [Rhodopirellula sallentina SM41]